MDARGREVSLLESTLTTYKGVRIAEIPVLERFCKKVSILELSMKRPFVLEKSLSERVVCNSKVPVLKRHFVSLSSSERNMRNESLSLNQISWLFLLQLIKPS